VQGTRHPFGLPFLDAHAQKTSAATADGGFMWPRMRN
jgi:hypothetical protein